MLTIYGLRLVSSDQYVYVGQTRLGGEKRFRSHVRSSRVDDIDSMRSIHRWIREQGEANVTYDVLDSTSATDESWLDHNEILWITKLRGAGHPLLNVQDGGSYNSQTLSVREKRGRSGEEHYNYGKTFSEETKAKLSESRKIRPVASEETRAKMAASRTGEKNPNFGRTFSEETRRKMSESAKGNTKRRGAVQSDAAKEKIREARKNQAPMSEETRQKISDSNKGKELSPEHRAKISAAISGEKHHAYGKAAVNKGVPMSEAQKEKLNESRPQARCFSWHGKRNYVDPDCEVCAAKVASGEVERFSTKEEIATAKTIWKSGRDTTDLSAKLSSQRKGRVTSDETKAKLSAAHKGIKKGPVSDETKAKMSSAKKGRVISEETKLRMRQGHHRRHADRGITKPGCEFCE